MTKTFKPMLADTAPSITTLRYPLYVSPKLDGVRCLIRDGVAVTRNLKPVPNLFVQSVLKGLPEGMDGELIVDSPTARNVFTTTQSAVMRASGEPWFVFYVFDIVEPKPFSERQKTLLQWFARYQRGMIAPVRQDYITTAAELDTVEGRCVAEGYEGVMVRCPKSPYKFGRSTIKEGYLLKIKRFEDDEAEVIGTQELMTNNNVLTYDALGYSARSKKKDGMAPGNMLGALLCRWRGVDFGIGTGLTDLQRFEWWQRRAELPGLTAKFKFQGVGPDGKPRFPVFLGWREAADMDGAA